GIDHLLDTGCMRSTNSAPTEYNDFMMQTMASPQVLIPTANLAVDVVVFTVRPGPVEQAWQVLLVKRNVTEEESRWGLPGVLVRGEETFDEAARRALLVKAGLD